MATYDDYRPESAISADANGKELTRTLYLRAEDEVEALNHADCPRRGDGIDVGIGSLTDYVYCESVSIAQVAEASASGGGFLWKVTARYTPIGRGNPTQNKARWELSFRPQPYTRLHVATDADQTHYGPDGSDAAQYPPVTTGINVTSDGVEGVELDEMVEVLTIEFWKSPNDVDDFLDDVRGIVNCVNNADLVGPWGTYAAGEARITGLSVGVVQGELASVQVEISRSKNLTGVSMDLDSKSDPISYDKDGWQYFWVRYLKANKDGDMDVRPLAIDAHVATVYADGDYSVLGISEEIWT